MNLFWTYLSYFEPVPQPILNPKISHKTQLDHFKTYFGPILDLNLICIRPIKRFLNFKSRVGIFPLPLSSHFVSKLHLRSSLVQSLLNMVIVEYTIELCSNYGLLLCTLLFSSLGLSSTYEETHRVDCRY